MRLPWREETPSTIENESPVSLFCATAPAHTNPWAVGTSTLVNGGVLAIALWMGIQAATHPASHPFPARSVDLSVLARHQLLNGHGGGGGGDHELIDAMVGRNPRFEITPLAPPQIPVINQPLLAIQPAIAVPPDVQLPDNTSFPNIGVHASTNVRLVSNGPGTDAGIGSGSHGGDGPGNGPGYGPGSDRGAGNGLYSPGTPGLIAPVPVVSPEAEFSDEARQHKYQGSVLISIIVDAHGNPQNLRVARSLGMGLDEKALEAVARYRFKPGMKGGHPVPVRLTVEVNFRLY